MARRSNSLSTKELSMVKFKIMDEEAFQRVKLANAILDHATDISSVGDSID